MAIISFNSIGGYAVGESQTQVISSNLDVTASSVSVTGNVTGDYIIGDGGLLSNIVPATIANGNSSITITPADGNISFAIAGIAAGYIGLESLALGSGANAANNTIILNATGNSLDGSNGFFVDPIRSDANSVANAVYYDPATAELTYAAPYADADVAAFLASGNTTPISVIGNISGEYFIGNGSQLTGLPAGYSNADVAAYLPNYSGALGGSLTTSYQPNITGVGTLGSLAVANSVSINGALDVVGNTTLGNLYVSGNINVPGNITVITGNAAEFYGDSYGFGALWAGLAFGYANLDFTVAEFSANNDDYAQINFQNINAGANATTDYIATADNGTNSTYYVDLGIASSTFDGSSANNIGNVIGANDSYLYAMGGNVVNPGGNLIIAAPGEEREIIFAAGGGSINDVVMTVSTGNVSVTGNLLASLISTAGNIDGGNIVSTRIVPRVDTPTYTTGSTIYPQPDANTEDQLNVYLTSTDAVSFLAPSGAPVDGQKITIRILGAAGGASALTWAADYRAIGVTLPTTTTAAKYIYVGIIYNARDTKWDVVSVATQA